MTGDTLEGIKVCFQESVIIYISVITDGDKQIGAVFSGSDLFAGGAGSYQACVGDENEDIFDVFCELDYALDRYQNDNPQVKMIEICSDDTIQTMNTMLEDRRLRPIDEDDFNFSETLFLISNPVLARQMGHGLE